MLASSREYVRTEDAGWITLVRRGREEKKKRKGKTVNATFRRGLFYNILVNLGLEKCSFGLFPRKCVSGSDLHGILRSQRCKGDGSEMRNDEVILFSVLCLCIEWNMKWMATV